MRKLIVLLVLVWVTIGVSAQELTPPIVYVPEVIQVFPHDGEAFTQGLLYHEGKLYESTGKTGKSELREIELETGTILRNVKVNRTAAELTGDNPKPDYFAEGLTLIDGKLIQLTWTEGEAFVYDLETFEKIDTINYTGEGWGICHDGKYIYNSDSTSYLDLRDINTFEPIVSFAVVYVARANDGSAISQIIPAQLLNELECVGDYIYANLWQTDLIVKIDKSNGNVVAFIDCTGLLSDEEIAAAKQRDPGATLNGIAYNSESDTFYITGKNWDKLFEVRFVEKQGS